jgi:transposase
MRGGDGQQAGMFSYVSPGRRIPADHPLRPIREMTNEVLLGTSRPAPGGSTPRRGDRRSRRRRLLRALLLQVLYSVRIERLLMEQLQYNLFFRWFVGLSTDDPVWDVTVFTKNRERLLRGDVAEAFFERVLELGRGERLLSDEHFSVDGTSRPSPDEEPADSGRRARSGRGPGALLVIPSSWNPPRGTCGTHRRTR